jgi:hypothetical protein
MRGGQLSDVSRYCIECERLARERSELEAKVAAPEESRQWWTKDSTALSEQVAYWKGQNRLTYEAQSQRAEQAEAALKQATERVARVEQAVKL